MKIYVNGHIKKPSFQYTSIKTNVRDMLISTHFNCSFSTTLCGGGFRTTMLSSLSINLLRSSQAISTGGKFTRDGVKYTVVLGTENHVWFGELKSIFKPFKFYTWLSFLFVFILVWIINYIFKPNLSVDITLFWLYGKFFEQPENFLF